MESKILPAREIAILITMMTIRILASRNSPLDNFEPKICSGKKLSVIPQMSAADARTQKREKNMPLSEARPSLSFFC